MIICVGLVTAFVTGIMFGSMDSNSSDTGTSHCPPPVHSPAHHHMGRPKPFPGPCPVNENWRKYIATDFISVLKSALFKSEQSENPKLKDLKEALNSADDSKKEDKIANVCKKILSDVANSGDYEANQLVTEITKTWDALEESKHSCLPFPPYGQFPPHWNRPHIPHGPFPHYGTNPGGPYGMPHGMPHGGFMPPMSMYRQPFAPMPKKVETKKMIDNVALLLKKYCELKQEVK